MPTRILVVEANRGVRALVGDVLTADGHEVTGVANGAEALVLLAQREQRAAFDLILSDLTIPALEGAHLYWEIARRWPHLVSRLICVTDGSSTGVIDHATLRAASVPFIVKPFSPEGLRDLVGRRLAELEARPSPEPPQCPDLRGG
jgi:DNA-binding NtrC family response regulator